MGIPVGQAALLLPAIGIADGLISAAQAAVGDSTKIGPVDLMPAAVGMATAVVMTKVKPVRKVLGNDATKALVIGAMVSGLNRSTHLSGWSRYGVARLAGILGHKSPWELVGLSESTWVALIDKEHQGHAGAMASAGLSGAPAHIALRPGMAAFEQVPALSGYDGAISAIDRNQQNINLPTVSTPV